jgi:MFS family permease
MAGVFATLLALLLSVLLALAGNGLLGTLLAVRLTDAGFGVVAASSVLAAYYAGFALGSLLADPVITSVGHIRAFTAFVALMAVVTLSHGLLPASWPWALLRGVAGLSMAGLFMVVESWLNAAADNTTRGQVLSAYMVTVYLGLGAGQLLLGTWPVGGLEIFCLAAMLLSLAAVPVSLTRTVAPELPSPERMPARELRARAPLGLAAALTAGVLAACIYSLAPIYGRMIDLASGEVSLLMSGLVFGGLLLQWPLGRLSDRMDRRHVMLGVALGTAAVSAALAVLPWLYLPAVLFGGLVFVIYPLGVAHTFDRVEPSEILLAARELLLANALGAVVGPPLASLVMQRLGAPGLFVFTGAVSLALAIAVFSRVVRFGPTPVEEQEPFVAVPRTTPAALELDPRGPIGEAGEAGEAGE